MFFLFFSFLQEDKKIIIIERQNHVCFYMKLASPPKNKKRNTTLPSLHAHKEQRTNSLSTRQQHRDLSFFSTRTPPSADLTYPPPPFLSLPFSSCSGVKTADYYCEGVQHCDVCCQEGYRFLKYPPRAGGPLSLLR